MLLLILIQLLLLSSAPLVKADDQKIQARSFVPLHDYCNLSRRGPDANLLRHIQDEADAMGSTCLLLISDREVIMEMFLPIARLTLAEVSR